MSIVIKKPFSKEDFQKYLQQAEQAKIWLGDFAVQHAAPICLVGLKSDGQVIAALPQDLNRKKIAEYLRKIATQIEFINYVPK